MGNYMTIDQLTRGVQQACDDLQTALRNNDDVMVEIALRMFCVWSTYLGTMRVTRCTVQHSPPSLVDHHLFLGLYSTHYVNCRISTRMACP